MDAPSFLCYAPCVVPTTVKAVGGQAGQTNLIKFSWPLFYLKLEIFISSKARMKKRKSIYDNYLGETNSRAALRHNCIKEID